MAALMVLASSLQAVITDVAAALQLYLDDQGLSFAIEITWQQQYGHRRREPGERL